MAEPKPVKMVVVNGVRYREEDAPDSSGEKATTPKNKSRTTSTKE